MNDTISELNNAFAAQKNACLVLPFPPAVQRKRDLHALRVALQRYQDKLSVAMSEDFGRRSEFECKMVDVMAPALQIDHALANMKRWMNPQRRKADWLFLTNRARVVYQPKGVVGVIAAWNFPVIEAVGPLITAIAAGNRAIIKMSEFSPHCTVVLRQMLSEIFSQEQVAVFGGGVELAQSFSGMPFDHIVFTGSPAIGRQIMRAASANLTPVTLELGGKSPAIVADSASIKAAAFSIAHGKVFNSGQACVAPDYVLIAGNRVDEFVAAVVTAFKQMVPDPVNDPEYTSMASSRHAARVQDLLKDALTKGASLTSCGSGDGNRIVALQVVTNVSSDMRIMQEELFNPILPIVAVDTVEQAMQYVTSRPRPLALYYYGRDRAELNRWTRDVHAGGMTVNDWAWHVFQCDLPFGGIGNSGMGSWRGTEGFLALSHAKAVFTEHRWFPVSLFRPPYGNLIQRLSLKMFLGSPDNRRN